MKKTDDRNMQLLKLLEEKRNLTVQEVADHFNVSLPTARRTCTQLAESGQVIRTHGGIRHIAKVGTDYSFDVLKNEHIDQKSRIAKYAAQLVQDKQTIFMEAGTTIEQFAIALAERIRSGEVNGVSIYTNSIINLNVLSPVVNVTLIGGHYRPDRKDFCGFLCERLLRTLRFDYCFTGADACNLTDRIMAIDVDTVSIDEILVARSEHSVVLAHSDKFFKNSLISYAPMEQVSLFITDNGLPQENYLQCKSAGVNLVCV